MTLICMHAVLRLQYTASDLNDVNPSVLVLVTQSLNSLITGFTKFHTHLHLGIGGPGDH